MARPTLGGSESKRLQLVITADEIERVDDWRFFNRVPTRSEAIRRLISVGLASTTARADLANQTKDTV